MQESDELAELIVLRLSQDGSAQSIRKRYEFIALIPNGIRISRETGIIWDIKKKYLIVALEAVRNEPAIYYAGPSRLRPYINKPIRSPIWAMLHLLTLDEILN